MLEQRGLLIGHASWSWALTWSFGKTPSPPVNSATKSKLPQLRNRIVYDLHSGVELGVVRSQTPRWPVVSWLSRQRWSVFETEDEALLCSLRSSWGLFRSWDVLDSEDNLVCTSSGNCLFDNRGKVRAVLEKATGLNLWQFFANDNTELGSLVVTSEGTELTFSHFVRRDPFTKMGLLGATLAATDKCRSRGSSKAVAVKVG